MDNDDKEDKETDLGETPEQDRHVSNIGVGVTRPFFKISFQQYFQPC